MFVEAGARFLLVWFFFLGAGLALRERAHVGFEFLRQTLPAGAARITTIVAHLTVLFFLGLLLCGAPEALELASMDFEATIGLTSFWATLAVPVGVVLMVYHQLCIIIAEQQLPPKAEID
jgi:TRAP-type C4-dicarboxylate transport system permease small subunit